MGILGAAAIAAVGGIGSAVIGSDAASSAANTQMQAANQASQTELQMFNQTQANEQPYMAADGNALQALMYGLGIGSPTGTAATVPTGDGTPVAPAYTGPSLDQIMAMQHDGIPGDFRPALAKYAAAHSGAMPTGHPATPAASPAANPNIGFGSLTAPFTADKFHASPGFNWDMSQMEGAVQNSAAARGGLVSGNTLKALQTNAMGLANQDFYNAQDSYYGRQNQIFNMLQTLAGSGQNAAANLGALGSNVAGQIGANTIGAGNSAAAGTVAQANTWANLLNNQSFLQGISSLFGGGGAPTNWDAMYNASNAGDWAVTI